MNQDLPEPTRHARHLLLRADAGTGKTYRLALQFLSLQSAGVDPRRILAVTFTRKAAGEILERVLLRLAEAVLDQDAARQLASELTVAPTSTPHEASDVFGGWLEDLVGLLPRLSIATLDAFFARLVQSFRYELGLTRMERIVALSDPAIESLRDRAMVSTLERLAAGSEPLEQLSARLYRGDAQRSLAWAVDRILLELHSVYRGSPSREAWAQLSVPSGLLDEAAFANALGAFRDWWQPEAEANRKAAELRLGKQLLGALEVSDRELAQHDWKQVLDGGVAGKVDEAVLEGRSECSYRRKAVAPELFSLLEPLVRHARAALLRELREQTLATHELLSVFDEEFQRVRQREGVVLFSDLAPHIAHGLPALSDQVSSEIAYRIDARVEHLLLDEFQDTSAVQWRALRLLVDEMLAWGDGSRTLFCVGDVKQSIYGWRGGRPELFGEVAALLEPLVESGAAAIESLDHSYRSSQLVLDAVNQVFTTLSQNQSLQARTEDHRTRHEAAMSWAEDFRPHRCAPVLQGQDGYVVLRTSGAWEGMFDDEVDDEDETASSAELPFGHLDFVAQQVAVIRERRPDAQIGVLARSNRVVSETLHALASASVEASGEGRGPIVDDPAVTCFVSALRLAAHPRDTASLLHLTGTPLGEVLELPPSPPPSADGPSLTVAASVSRRVRQDIADSGLCAVFSRWVRRLAPHLTSRSGTRLQQLFEILLEQRPQIDRDPAGAVRIIEQATVDEPAPAPVRVMTVHQAKGLQFDVVVLCELEVQLGAQFSPLVEVLSEGSQSHAAAVVRASNATTRRGSPLLEQAHAQEIDRRMRDDLSALYVALTRARTELHLIVQPLAPLPGRKTPRSDNFVAAGVLRSALGGDHVETARAEPNVVLYETGCPIHEAPEEAARPAVAPATRASAARSSRGPKQTASPGKALLDPTSRADTLRPFETSIDGRLRGRLLHAYLAQIGFLPKAGGTPRPWLTEASVQQINRSVAPFAGREFLQRVATGFKSLESWSELRALLEQPGTRHQCWRELPYASGLDARGNPQDRGVIDRVVVGYLEDGRVGSAAVVDYKTGGSGSRTQHVRQLERYRAVVSQMTGLLEHTIEAGLVWLDERRIEFV